MGSRHARKNLAKVLPPTLHTIHGQIARALSSTSKSRSGLRKSAGVTDKELPLEPPLRPGNFRSMSDSLGIFSTTAIIGGSFLILLVVASLVFIWVGEGSNDGANASSLWRTIALGQLTTQTATLASVVLSIVVASQAAICTSLVAAMVLENGGVPLSLAAEVSVIRGVNDGPLKLTWLLFTSLSARRSALQTAMVAILLVTSTAIQFTSTLLVSDLQPGPVVTEPAKEALPLYMDNAALNLLTEGNNLLGSAPAFTPFAEVPSRIDPTPTEAGLSDTGIVTRIFLTVPSSVRATLRQYTGGAFAVNSRIACMPPVLVAPTIQVFSQEIVAADPHSTNYLLFMSGAVDYDQTLQNAGLNYTEICPSMDCFAASYNCTFPTVPYPADLVANGGFLHGLCLPGGDNANAENITLAADGPPISQFAMPFLVHRNNGTELDAWSVPSGQNSIAPIHGANVTAAVPATSGEWSVYSVSGASSPVGLDVSLCFQQMAVSYVPSVTVSTPVDLPDLSVSLNSTSGNWNTSAVQVLVGASAASASGTLTATQRGLFALDAPAPYSTTTDQTYLLTNEFYFDEIALRTWNVPTSSANLSALMCPVCSGLAEIGPSVEYRALFNNAVYDTEGRPALALQAVLTVYAGATLDYFISRQDGAQNVTLRVTYTVQIPGRFAGLAAVCAIVSVHLVVVTFVTLRFLGRTRWSSHGNYWHAVAQLVGEDDGSHSKGGITGGVLKMSVLATDAEVRDLLNDRDPIVKVAQSEGTGRVQVVRADGVT